MTQQPDYKTLPDGSIDYAYYDNLTRDLRAHSFQAAFKSLFGALSRGLRPRPKNNAATKPTAKANLPKPHPTL